MENRLKAKWAAGEPTFGAWLAIPSPLVAEAVAGAGFDYVCVDMQHGAADYQMAIAMLAAMRGSDTTPIVRVPWNEPGIIGRMLDAGALGIVIPMVNSVAEAQAAVAGIDAVYIGPADLSITYGLPPGVDNPGTVFDDALAKVVSCCQARGITPGIHGTAAVSEKRVAGGFRMVTVSADLGAVTTGMRADLKQARSGATAGAARGSGDKIY
jgi:4-hydroxy-2-oxoheptanedioate aldolase